MRNEKHKQSIDQYSDGTRRVDWQREAGYNFLDRHPMVSKALAVTALSAGIVLAMKTGANMHNDHVSPDEKKTETSQVHEVTHEPNEKIDLGSVKE